MQSERAAELRKKWGDKPCNHPAFEKEYKLGFDTGDYFCIICWNLFTKEEKAAIERKEK